MDPVPPMDVSAGVDPSAHGDPTPHDPPSDADVPGSAADRRLVIVGAGGHGRELFDTVCAINAARPDLWPSFRPTDRSDMGSGMGSGTNTDLVSATSAQRGPGRNAARAKGWDVVGFVDDAPSHPDRIVRLGSAILGDIAWLEAHPRSPRARPGRSASGTPLGAVWYALGIGSSAMRRVLAARLDEVGCRPATIVHPSVHVGLDVQIGDGVVIYDRSTVTTNVTIGRHTHLNVGCVVQHDSVVGEFVQFSPGVFVNGDCSIGDDVFLGTGAIVTRGCSVGDGARVGAGAVVLSDVGAGETVVGVPAKPRR